MFEKKEDVLFWLGIMRDHAIFQVSALASKEQPFIQKAMEFRDFFQSMMNDVSEKRDWEKLVPRILTGVNDFLNFKRSILKGLLSCKLEINLPPSFINHQINEGMEFQSALTREENYYKNFYDPINFMFFLKNWISDSSGHAAAYASFLDPTEGMLRNEALEFKNKFDMLAVKANELQMMMMQSKAGSGAFSLLIEEVSELMKKLFVYLQKIYILRSGCRVMAIGTLAPLLPNHMIREHEYYLSKINEYIEANK